METMANTYRMTDRDIRLMIQLRATNATIFTGRRNSAMKGWRAIRKEMGVQGALSAQQLKKKWDNLKDKYRVLKNPPVGMENMIRPSSWRWFQLMDEAMSGRMVGSASILQPCPLDEDEELCGAPLPLILPNTGAAFSGLTVVETGNLEGVGTFGEVLQLGGTEACGSVEALSRTESPAEVFTAGGDGEDARSPECELTVTESQPVINKSQTAVLYATLLPNCTADTNGKPFSCRQTDGEVDRKLLELQREWQALEREQAEFDRELIALERDRHKLNRDAAAQERDRMVVERERAAVERDRVAVERDQAFLDRDRAFLDRDRVLLERAREDLESERALLRRERAVLEREGTAEMTTEKEVVLHTRFYQRLMAADVDPEQLETRQRLVSLFQRLVEKL